METQFKVWDEVYLKYVSDWNWHFPVWTLEWMIMELFPNNSAKIMWKPVWHWSSTESFEDIWHICSNKTTNLTHLKRTYVRISNEKERDKAMAFYKSRWYREAYPSVKYTGSQIYIRWYWTDAICCWTGKRQMEINTKWFKDITSIVLWQDTQTKIKFEQNNNQLTKPYTFNDYRYNVKLNNLEPFIPITNNTMENTTNKLLRERFFKKNWNALLDTLETLQDNYNAVWSKVSRLRELLTVRDWLVSDLSNQINIWNKGKAITAQKSAIKFMKDSEDVIETLNSLRL